jgi:DNA-binding XRE family transcriptional regulator
MKYDTDFKRLIPPLSKEEYDLLKKNILKDGCRDAIVVWTETLTNGERGRTMILDGHNRYEICEKNKIESSIMELKLKSMDEAKIWVIQNQLGRRNLTDYQKGKLALELKTMIQEKAKEKQKKGGERKVSQKSDEASMRTDEELAKLAGVSHDTIHKIEVIEKEAPPEIKEAASSGKFSINKAYQATKKPISERNKISRILDSRLTEQWEKATKEERRQFLRMRILNVKDKLSRYRFSNESQFSESEKEYYAKNPDEWTIDIILKFGIYYNEVPKFSHRKGNQ